ncbi:MAG: zinc ribbon domain-containing protein [Candidatus Omnitrophica bacterium]|nr:zinc ribbon domain-containing protein [Candidatus Omnitrophota bacterium]
MPTYEYLCQKCKHRFDQFQPISAKPLTQCPKCKGKIRRVISGGSGVLFKGSGFYATDYRSSSYQEKASKEKSNAKKSEPCSGTPSTCEKPTCPSKN